ncbi:MAG: hypothetical protein EHM59_05785 [Betaproteobacteria bacterium]|nr:MAG: hypothetical protein EHM59_05785 [Betaproteobacteria bacterium]
MTTTADFDDDMPAEIDFAGATRGKFHRAGAALHVAVYLDATVQGWLLDRARAQGVDLSEQMNALLRKDIERIESAR